MYLPKILTVTLLVCPTLVTPHPGHMPGGGEFGAIPDLYDEHEGQRPMVGLPKPDDTKDTLPDEIKAFDLVIFTGSEFRMLANRLQVAPDKGHVIGMSNDLALKTAEAGQVAPIDVGRLVFEMLTSADKAARTRVLENTSARLLDEQARLLSSSAETGGPSPVVKQELHKIRVLLALVAEWQSDPMNGRK